MLFNSYEFIFLFLPVTLVGFFLIGRSSQRIAAAWLAAASLFFYGWWNPAYVGLLVASILGNYYLGTHIARSAAAAHVRRARTLLVAAVIGNLCLLAYYKYANFFVTTVNDLTGSDLSLGSIVLPLGISFFTFTQIAFLVDAHRGEVNEYRFIHYGLFVTYFPHLIAGPVLHHKEMMPQFDQPATYRFNIEKFAVGLTIFSFGLFKKVVLADGIAPYANDAFTIANAGGSLSFFPAWGGVLAYTLQLYFDFSGYSDMAIGGALLFGIRLPLNFFSPYKATSIIEFWRRWHMTLSRFLRDYLYIALGGNRKGPVRRYINLFATMLLGGLWHGAGWTFVIWGGLHGAFLIINHYWRWVRTNSPLARVNSSLLSRSCAWAITFLAVVVGWVFFRAESVQSALLVLNAMLGGDGVAIPNGIAAQLGEFWITLSSWGMTTYIGGGATLVKNFAWVVALMFIALAMPNTCELLAAHKPAFDTYIGKVGDSIRPLDGWVRRITWTPQPAWAVLIAVIATFSLMSLSQISEFLYFQF